MGYSLDNLSLMALTISTGFVVDDAIVVLENVTRHIEGGMPRMQAALQGTREVAFTVLSMSLSLVAVFVPILLMGGIDGRLFREFAVTLSVAVMISLVVSLTTTPMMCAYLLAERRDPHPTPGTPALAGGRPGAPPQAGEGMGGGRLYHPGEHAFAAILDLYDRSLRRALQWPALVMLSLLATVGFAVYLFINIPKGFVPEQDNGLMWGGIQADQTISFRLMEKKLAQFVDIVREDPAVAHVDGFYYGGSYGDIFVVLKPLSERRVSAQQVAYRLQPNFDQITGAEVDFGAAQDVRIGGRASHAQYEYTLLGEDNNELYAWAPRVANRIEKAAAAERCPSRPEAAGP